MKPGVFIVIDGIAGSGKSTILADWKSWATERSLKTFDLLAWTQAHSAPPTLEDVGDAEILFTFEPTKQWVGSAIRQEMSHRGYTGIELAHAFALDRLIQYRRLILPARAAGKVVIQDRSVTSSIAYQPIMPGGPALEDLLTLPGNALALAQAPDHVVLTRIAPEQIAERLKRADDSKGVFEDIELLRRIDERFRSDWFAALLTQRGTQVHELNTSTDLSTTLTNARSLLTQLLSEA